MADSGEHPLQGAIVSAFHPVVLTKRALLSELPRDIAEHIHLYAICWRPRITVRADAWTFDEDVVQAAFTLHQQEDVLEFEADMTNVWQRTDLIVRSEPPHTDFTLQSADGEDLFTQHSGWWLAQMLHMSQDADLSDPAFPSELFDLEVLYVGQAYGEDGSRAAVDRLLTHERLLDVYERALEEARNMEVWIVLMGLAPTIQLVQMMPGRPPWPSDEDLGEEFARLITADISGAQRVSFTEAALIRYFDPPFNRDYTKSFPTAAHKTYRECYDLDLNSVGFEFDSRNLLARLKSCATEPSYFHSATFPLHDATARRAIFDFAGVSATEEPPH